MPSAPRADVIADPRSQGQARTSRRTDPRMFESIARLNGGKFAHMPRALACKQPSRSPRPSFSFARPRAHRVSPNDVSLPRRRNADRPRTLALRMGVFFGGVVVRNRGNCAKSKKQNSTPAGWPRGRDGSGRDRPGYARIGRVRGEGRAKCDKRGNEEHSVKTTDRHANPTRIQKRRAAYGGMGMMIALLLTGGRRRILCGLSARDREFLPFEVEEDEEGTH